MFAAEESKHQIESAQRFKGVILEVESEKLMSKGTRSAPADDSSPGAAL